MLISAGDSLRYRVARRIGQNKLAFKGKGALMRWLGRWHDRMDQPFRVSLFGYEYDGNLINELDWFIYFYGTYSYHEIELLIDVSHILEEKGSVVLWDVGANVGSHTLAMSSHVTQICAFEPNPVVRRRLQRALQANGIENVEVFPVGLAERDASLDFFMPSKKNPGSGSFAEPPKEWLETRKLPVVHGDSFRKTHNLPSPTIIKIDVEGFERSVLAGLHQCLERQRPVILAEMSPESRRQFGDEANFRRCLYDNHRLFAVSINRLNSSYKLRPFKYAKTTEYIVIPKEHEAWLMHHLQSGRW